MVASETFERRKKVSVYWHNKACDLLGSAAAVWAAMHDTDSVEKAKVLGLGEGFSFAIACPPVFRMLCGMAYELLLKAIIVAKGGEPEPTHDLVALGKAADVSFTKEEIGLLRILSASIIWAGRYPIPKKQEHLEELTELCYEHLFDRVPLGKLQVFHPNQNLEWQSFLDLWQPAAICYWEHHS
jgi:hypothetical protein